MADAKSLAAEAKRLLRETASYALEDDARLHQSGALAESIIDQLAALVTESADARDAARLARPFVAAALEVAGVSATDEAQARAALAAIDAALAATRGEDDHG